ncbi:hypothetical protein [Castellaniella denitrificans]|uniref:Uncharacterized protein n=1 Tax=Castellaniella denitrificans TaxID=56119 RepID=A0ABT4M620_9BURK|nr:hypothetical protein [Castellaniella denitrificans]MCZ4330751.1 hypothetical protein [Castellaniella denitrificans]
MNDRISADPLENLQREHELEFEFEHQEKKRQQMPTMLEENLRAISGFSEQSAEAVSSINAQMEELRNQVRGLENQMVYMLEKSRPTGWGTVFLGAICAMLAYALFFRA